MVETRLSAWLSQLRPELAFLRGEDVTGRPRPTDVLNENRHHGPRTGAVDEAFPEAPDHFIFVTGLAKAPAGDTWKFTLREKE